MLFRFLSSSMAAGLKSVRTVLLIIGLGALLGGLLVFASWAPAQLLTWALPYFHIRGIGLMGPWFLTASLGSVMSSAIGFSQQRKN